MRDELMEAGDISPVVIRMRADAMKLLFDRYVPPNTLEEQWDIQGLEDAVEREFAVRPSVGQWLESDYRLDEAGLLDKIIDQLESTYQGKVNVMAPETLHQFQKTVMLQVLDNSWKEHLSAMDHLRQGIHLRGYAQKDPKQEYKREAFEMFTSMLDAIKHEVISIISMVRVQSEESVRLMEEQNQLPKEMHYEHATAQAMTADDADSPPPPPEPTDRPSQVRDEPKVGRNDPCPCGSGQKYKHCHGKLA
jgi:preprotein translocase subunit SecA